MNFVILGMHRSGTSLLVGLLEQHGFELGKVSNKTSVLKPTGTKEHTAIRAINNQIFSENKSDWKKPSFSLPLSDKVNDKCLIIANEFREKNMWAIKDPRMTITYPVWKNVLPPHQVIGTFRKPIEVAQSLFVKNQISIQQGFEIWLAYNKSLMSLCKLYDFPLVEYQTNQDAYAIEIQKITDCYDIAFDESKICHFFTRPQSTKNLPNFPEPPEVINMYRELLATSKLS